MVEGYAVGGPKDGQRICCPTRTHEFTEMAAWDSGDRVRDGDRPGFFLSRRGRYEYDDHTIAGKTIWAWKGWDDVS